MDEVRAPTRSRRLPLVVVLVMSLASVGVVVASQHAPAATQVHLTAAGDFGARATTSGVLEKVADLAPDAHLALGDLAYRDVASESAWCDFVKQHVGEGFPFELVSGNHESLDVADGAINDYSACLPNQIPGVVGTYGREYYMDFPRGAPLVRVIQVSPGLTFEDGVWRYLEGDAHHTWLANAIDSGRALGAKWIVVGMHVPCQSVGVYSCPTTDVFDLLAAKRVDLVLHGHEHAYMRTHQLAAGSAGCPTIPVGSFEPACVSDDDDAFVAGQGTVFATVGTGGIPLRNVNASDAEAGYFAAFQGLNSNPSHGLLDISITDTELTARFEPTGGGTFTDGFTITRTGSNQPPIASFTASVQDRTVAVDGSSSFDLDGSVEAHHWDYGDGTTDTGATPAPHTYATAGTYTVTLTVTDDDSAAGTTSRSVTATDPLANLAQDSFTRTVASGWGAADLGGAWTVSPQSAFAVNGASGTITSNAGNGRTAYLRSVSTDSSDVVATLASNKLVQGSGLYVSMVGRSLPGVGDYRGVVRFHPDGRVAVRLSRVTGSTESIIAPETVVPGLLYSPTERVNVRLQVTGTAPTTLRIRAWRTGTSEPTTWNLTTTDVTAGLQATGSVGLVTYLSSSAANAPIVLSVDDLVVTRP